MNKPLIRGRKNIQQISQDRSPSVLLADEKIFTVQATHNSQNDRILTWKKEDIPVELRTAFRRQKPPSVMVWAGVTSDGKRAPLIFVE
ncbi:Putative DD37D maT transposase [Caligus rogercresseyi]|uniref:DD37D maT transposase n=1 Tax=Caligus rogercresseyi TaxID=217165 RepID=A0A7T8JX14_CALRO|nr:Putative DD37D maT transposase [Caligus rogercresseyi]